MSPPLRFCSTAAFAIVLAVPLLAADGVPVAEDRAATAPPSITVKEITGRGGEWKSAVQRIRMARQLPAVLSSVDVQALLEFCGGPRPSGIDSRQWPSLVNDVLDKLLMQRAPVTGMASFLIAMSERTDDPVLADYAIQKLGGMALPSSNPEQDEIVAALRRAAGREGEALQGTAFLAWQRCLLRKLARREHPELPRPSDTPGTAVSEPAATLELPSDFREALVLALRSDKTATVAMATLLSIAAKAAPRHGAETARRVLTSSSAPISLRIAAIHALGAGGELSDLVILQRCRQEAPLQRSADLALSRIGAR